MYKNYIFDMGNVLLGFNDERLLSAFLDDEDDKKLVEKELIWSEEWQLGDKGLINEEEFLSRVLARLPERLHEGATKVYLNWHRLMDPIPGALDYVKQLKKEGKKTYVLSNAPLRFSELEKLYPELFSLFDGIVVSAREKSIKPEDKIYRVLLERYSLNPAECYFYDDLQCNIDGAKKNGIDGEVFRGSFLHLLKENKNENE
ncbi:MAG: HAD family phosphatase [Ruminococcaceae bacterium]|jgi:putative hydrolase of the HAD superfamily|nr:HAD family phosphatase [Oscillospiraceae bacterium]